LTITRQNLEGKFRLFNDEELRRLYHSGDLTELAREVAAAELQQRGLDLAKPQVAVASEQPSKTPTEPAAVDLFQLLFGFSGRINRAKYWLAVVIYSVAVLIVPVILFSFSVALVSTPEQKPCNSSSRWRVLRSLFGALSRLDACAATSGRTSMGPTRSQAER